MPIVGILRRTPRWEANPKPEFVNTISKRKRNRKGREEGTFWMPYTASIDKDNLRHDFRTLLFNSLKKTHQVFDFPECEVKWNVFFCHFHDFVSLMAES